MSDIPDPPEDTSALARIEAMRAEIAADPEHPYRNPSHPGHEAANAEMAALYAEAYPPDPADDSDQSGGDLAIAEAAYGGDDVGGSETAYGDDHA